MKTPSTLTLHCGRGQCPRRAAPPPRALQNQIEAVLEPKAAAGALTVHTLDGAIATSTLSAVPSPQTETPAPAPTSTPELTPPAAATALVIEAATVTVTVTASPQIAPPTQQAAPPARVFVPLVVLGQ